MHTVDIFRFHRNNRRFRQVKSIAAITIRRENSYFILMILDKPLSEILNEIFRSSNGWRIALRDK